MKHAGIHWPNGPEKFGLLSTLPASLWLMTSPEARFHYDKMRRLGKVVVWRDVPAPGNRPAELRYDARKAADASMVLWKEQPHNGVEHFQSHCELNLNYERGDNDDDHNNLDSRMDRLVQFLGDLEPALRQRLPAGTRLHFPPWVPDERAYDRLDRWRELANRYDVVSHHEYGPPEDILERVQWHLDTWPTKGVILSEWHNDEPERTLQLLAELAAREPRFLGATWFIAHWYGAPADWPAWKNLQDNEDLYRIFLDPPTVAAPPVPEPTMPDPYEHFTAQSIAAAAECPLDAVQENWPKLVKQLTHCGINERLVQIGMIGTVAKESASTFAPVREAFFLGEPEPAESHRKTLRYYPYYGRGLIQNTHRSGYASLGPKIAALWDTDPNQPDFDLVANPDNLLNPDFSAAAAAIFFRDTETLQGYSLVDACRARDWDWVRRLVLGGPDPDGAARIARIAAALEGGAPTMPIRFDATFPATIQDDDWSCAPSSLDWALRSLGRTPGHSYIENLLVQDGIVSREQGLLVGTGGSLAAWIGRKTPADVYYGADGFYGNSEPSITFDGAALEGDHSYPILIGGHNWGGPNKGHWAGVRGYDAGRDVLLLANPAGSGGVFGGQEMTRSQFNARGPFSMVRVLHPDIDGSNPTPPVPIPPLPPVDTRLERALEQARGVVRILEEAAP